MMPLLLLAQSESGGQISQIARTFGVDWSHLAAQMISFSIVCFILYRFAYQRILKVLEDRRLLIEKGLANAEMIKAELAKTEARRQEVLTQANAQASLFIEEARTAAARLQDQETQKAAAIAEQIVSKAREAAAVDYERMLAELKRDVGRLVVQTAAAVTGKILTPDDQKRLAEETARQLSS
jgi:F-type H+-transporting ATPase subunit b